MHHFQTSQVYKLQYYTALLATVCSHIQRRRVHWTLRAESWAWWPTAERAERSTRGVSQSVLSKAPAAAADDDVEGTQPQRQQSPSLNAKNEGTFFVSWKVYKTAFKYCFVADVEKLQSEGLMYECEYGNAAVVVVATVDRIMCLILSRRLDGSAAAENRTRGQRAAQSSSSA